MATFATAFPTTAPITPNASSSLKRRMSPLAPVWPECNNTKPVAMMQQQQHQPSFKRARLSHNSPGELCLQRDLKSLSHSHQWNYHDTPNGGGCWVYEQDPNIRLHKTFASQENQQLRLEFSQNANITIDIPRMYPHQTPTVTKIQGLWMDAILIRQQEPSSSSCHHSGVVLKTNKKTVVLDQWSPILHISTLLDFCIHHAKMHPTCAHAKLPTNNTHPSIQQKQDTHEEPTHHPFDGHHHHPMEVSHPYKYTSPFAPNRMDVGYNKQQQQYSYQYYQQAPSQDAMEM